MPRRGSRDRLSRRTGRNHDTWKVHTAISRRMPRSARMNGIWRFHCPALAASTRWRDVTPVRATNVLVAAGAARSPPLSPTISKHQCQTTRTRAVALCERQRYCYVAERASHRNRRRLYHSGFTIQSTCLPTAAAWYRVGNHVRTASMDCRLAMKPAIPRSRESASCREFVILHCSEQALCCMLSTLVFPSAIIHTMLKRYSCLLAQEGRIV